MLIVALVLGLGGCGRSDDLSDDATTLLHWAAGRGETTVIAELLARDVPVDRVDGSGRVPVATAADGGHPEAVVMLLQAGADPSAVLADGRTLLHWAAETGETDTIRLILDAAAGDEASTASPGMQHLLEAVDPDGLTPVERAASADQPEAVLVLLEYGAAADRYWRSPRGLLGRLLD